LSGSSGGGLDTVKLLCVYIYEGKDTDELGMKAGDEIEVVLSQQSDPAGNHAWWRGRNLKSGSTGTFPLAFTEGWEKKREGGGLARFSTLSLRNSYLKSAPPPVKEVIVEEKDAGVTMKAVYDFNASNQEEISIAQGDMLINVSGDGEWISGENTRTGETGEFPSAFVETFIEAGLRKKREAYAVALFDFDAGDADELELREGDVVEDVEREDENWMRGRLNGRCGVFPSTYVEIKG
jgi:hypothetical protein